MPEVTVVLGKSMTEVGLLRFDSDQNRQFSIFKYSKSWLMNEYRFSISPDLPLQNDELFISAKTPELSNTNRPLHGCFLDASPDSWGRMLLRKINDAATEFDYLIQADDFTRQGALRFLGKDGNPVSQEHPPIPRLNGLKFLKYAANATENNLKVEDNFMLELVGAGSSLGGARPKANIMHDGELWIAKFTSLGDTRAVERAEVATLKLARLCGLHTPECKLEHTKTDSPVALIKRFDRRGEMRIPYMSVRTALNIKKAESYYTTIADLIREISDSCREDLHELWKRVVFTVLVSNTDDHLKNHGFVYVGRGFWRLSPMFDVNPMPERQRFLKTGIMEGESFESSLDLALEASYFFDIHRRDAEKMALEMAKTIAGNWKKIFKAAGARTSESNSYKPAFEHSEMDKALGLT